MVDIVTLDVICLLRLVNLGYRGILILLQLLELLCVLQDLLAIVRGGRSGHYSKIKLT